MTPDLVVYFFRELQAAFFVHFAQRAWWEWLLFFFPFFIFGEIPRYILPAVMTILLRAFGYPRDDVEQRRRFLETRPTVSVLLVGYNEEESIADAIESLLEFRYPGLEIIVIDDGSTDRMYERAKPFADRGLIKLYRNSSASGRAGRPVVSNMALRLSGGEFLLSVDADTSFDRDALLHMIGPFYDPDVGVVAGNLKPRNTASSLWARLQALEYFQSITLWKSWLNLLGCNMQASGAFGAFRRSALLQIGAWDAELAEDADLSLKIKKSGWRIVFAPRAIAMTNVPETLRQLIGQRYRWDRGMLRTYFRKHRNLLKFWRFDWRNALEMGLEYFFSVLLTFIYVVWITIMVVYYPVILIFVFIIAYFVYAASALLTVTAALLLSERRREEWPLLLSVPAFPPYKGLLRLVRLYALVMEIVRVNYEQSYLPESAWRNTRRW